MKKMSIVDSCEKWLRNIFTINIILNENADIKIENSLIIDLDFDFPKWLENQAIKLKNTFMSQNMNLNMIPKN